MRHRWLGLTLSVGATLGALAVGAAVAGESFSRLDATRSVLRDDSLGSPRDWRLHHTANFVVAYAGEANEVLPQAELLELAHERFHEAFGAAPFTLDPLRGPLVALFFQDKADYLRYARSADRVDMSWTVAYYSAKTNRIAFFRNGATRHGDDHADGGSESTPALHLFVSGDEAISAPAENPIMLASATHEAAHQLAFNTGLQRRGVIYPLWASEGLATNFELRSPGGDFGPQCDNPTRRDRLVRTWEADGLMRLHDLITLTRVPTDDARATDELYAQAWGFFQFLYTHRRDQLADYFAAMRTAPRGHRSVSDMRDEFTAAFGAMDVLDQQWSEWVAGQAGAPEVVVAITDAE